MSKIAEDLEKLTTIPEKKITELFSKLNYIFCQTIKEDMLEGKTLSTFDFGIFTVYVNYEESDRIRYKIIPSKEMNNVVKGTINGKLNLLDDKLSSNLAEKFMNIYKDIC